jgi:hypothetical protein
MIVPFHPIGCSYKKSLGWFTQGTFCYLYEVVMLLLVYWQEPVVAVHEFAVKLIILQTIAS